MSKPHPYRPYGNPHPYRTAFLAALAGGEVARHGVFGTIRTLLRAVIAAVLVLLVMLVVGILARTYSATAVVVVAVVVALYGIRRRAGRRR